ncbi:hypothetical protein [Paraburkholderia sp.]|uniref:hypothetical protein n=1 Tax=Paraburkholderia sp. TaxID=1926495 RepID=UPI002D63C8F3|nr:hypothetical protein [Paraburkholderia sp.]HZZ04612.1 hypothetical protein [Paraburkholderia sp.]
MKLRMLCRDSDGPYAVEVEGDPVNLPNMPDGAFAVHPNPFAGDFEQPLFCVSHIATGGKMAGGDSIDFAVSLARKKAKLVSPEMYATEISAHQAIADGVSRVLQASDFPQALERSGPRIVCAGCGTPTDSLARPLCATCSGQFQL